MVCPAKAAHRSTSVLPERPPLVLDASRSRLFHGGQGDSEVWFFARDEMVRLVETFPHQSRDVSAEDPVDLMATVALGVDETGEAELRQVLADRRARGFDRVGQFAGCGRSLREQPQELQARGLSDQREHVSSLTQALEVGALRMVQARTTRRRDRIAHGAADPATSCYRVSTGRRDDATAAASPRTEIAVMTAAVVGTPN